MVGTNIKELRNEHHMTQSQLAQKLNVSDKTVSSWEVGRTKPDYDMEKKIASIFGVSTLRLHKFDYNNPALVESEAFQEYLAKLGYYVDEDIESSTVHISGHGTSCDISFADYAQFEKDIKESVSYHIWRFSKKT